MTDTLVDGEPQIGGVDHEVVPAWGRRRGGDAFGEVPGQFVDLLPPR